MEKNWYQELKIQVIALIILSNELEDNLSNLLINNIWMYDDINFYQSYENMQEINLMNNINLDSYAKYLNYLDVSCVCFSSRNLKNEFEILKENYNLSFTYLLNIIRYIISTNEYSYANNQQEIIESYFNYDKLCYSQLKLNNKELKKYRKERKDKVE